MARFMSEGNTFPLLEQYGGNLLNIPDHRRHLHWLYRCLIEFLPKDHSGGTADGDVGIPYDE